MPTQHCRTQLHSPWDVSKGATVVSSLGQHGLQNRIATSNALRTSSRKSHIQLAVALFVPHDSGRLPRPVRLLRTATAVCSTRSFRTAKRRQRAQRLLSSLRQQSPLPPPPPLSMNQRIWQQSHWIWTTTSYCNLNLRTCLARLSISTCKLTKMCTRSQYLS